MDKTQTPEYWEARLKRMGLSMEAGRKVGSETLTYGYTLEDLAGLDEHLQTKGKHSREIITGESLEHTEWPVSLC